MSGLQIRAIVLAIALVVLDGYDVSLTSFSAPYIEKGFGVSKAELGLVMSGALIGMLVGSIIVAPLADRIGRRRMGVVSTSTIAVGMFIGPFATPETGTWPLVVSRIVTGVGVGCLVAVVGVIPPSTRASGSTPWSWPSTPPPSTSADCSAPCSWARSSANAAGSSAGGSASS
jgi:MFS family permease